MASDFCDLVLRRLAVRSSSIPSQSQLGGAVCVSVVASLLFPSSVSRFFSNFYNSTVSHPNTLSPTSEADLPKIRSSQGSRRETSAPVNPAGARQVMLRLPGKALTADIAKMGAEGAKKGTPTFGPRFFRGPTFFRGSTFYLCCFAFLCASVAFFAISAVKGFFRQQLTREARAALIFP
jgi:hypothetical protein